MFDGGNLLCLSLPESKGADESVCKERIFRCFNLDWRERIG